METKRDIEAKAKALIESSPNEAIVIYQQIWDDYRDAFNSWDAFFTIKAMRNSTSLNLDWAKEIVTKYDDDKVKNLYGWLIFDKCIKSKNRQEVIVNEKYISDLASLCPQKNLKEDNPFPCPTTISIFKFIDAINDNIYNARRTNELLSKLNYQLLSREAKTLDTEKKGEIEMASDFEKFIALRTKALLKLEEYEECKKFCELGLIEISPFHYNNDLWLKMRIALCEEHLGNLELSEKLFQDLLRSRAGSDKWFLYRDIAELYYEKENFNKAWKYSVDAAFYGNEPHFLIGLYLLQARILFKLARESEGKILAELIAGILRDREWNDKTEYNKLFEHYGIDRSNLRETKEILTESQNFWSNERYGDQTKSNGIVISIHGSGKKGRIKNTNGSIIDFHKKNLISRIKDLNSIRGAEVEYYEIEAFDGKNIAEAIDVISKPNIQVNKTYDEGEIVNGVVKNITNFGIFVKLPKKIDGLLHVNNLPEHLKGTYRENFKINENILVEVIKITAKGIQLGYIVNDI
jgi:hypothetical protein